MYPQGRLCPSTILWRADTEDDQETKSKQAWILVHPAVWDTVWAVMMTAVEHVHEGRMWKGIKER